MARIRLASAALLLALAAGAGTAAQASAASPSTPSTPLSASTVTAAQDHLPTAPAVGGPDDMYWD